MVIEAYYDALNLADMNDSYLGEHLLSLQCRYLMMLSQVIIRCYWCLALLLVLVLLSSGSNALLLDAWAFIEMLKASLTE